MLRVLGIDVERVIVAVLLSTGTQDLEGLATIAGDMQEDVHLIDGVDIMG